MYIDSTVLNVLVHGMVGLVHDLKQAHQLEFALRLEEIRKEIIMSLETDTQEEK